MTPPLRVRMSARSCAQPFDDVRLDVNRDHVVVAAPCICRNLS